MCSLSRFFCTLLLVCASLAAIAASPAPQLRDLAVLEDPFGQKTIETVATADASRFKPLPAGSYAGGFTRSVHWFRFTVAQAGETWLDILPPVLDDLRLYETNPVRPGAWLERRSGDTLPFAMREVPYRGFVFKLHHDDDAPRTYYLRLQTSSTSILSPRLWTPENFIAATALESSLLMASIAIVLTVLLLNMNNWFWLRDPLTPWFMLYLLTLAIFFLGTTGFLQQSLFPDWPPASYYAASGSALLLIAAANGFYRRFFGIERDTPIVYWLYRINTWLPMLALPIMLMGYFNEIGAFFNGSATLMTLVGLLMSWRLWRRGAAGGGMMFVANLITMVSILFFILNSLGVLAGGFVLWHSLHIGSLGSIIALQLALGARTRALRDAQLQAERDAAHERDMRIRQGQFLAMLAHELRTALSVLQMAVGVQPMSPKAAASAERAMAGMSDVIERSIQVEKFADGSQGLETRHCDVATLLEAVIADSHDPARFLVLCASRPTVVTDAKLLRVILNNLIDNALKYSPAASPIKVELQFDAALRLCVCNAVGTAGYPDPAHVFDKYYRAPGAHETTGSGLGLYIARALAELLGGELCYRPTTDRIRFELRL